MEPRRLGLRPFGQVGGEVAPQSSAAPTEPCLSLSHFRGKFVCVRIVKTEQSVSREQASLRIGIFKALAKERAGGRSAAEPERIRGSRSHHRAPISKCRDQSGFVFG